MTIPRILHYVWFGDEPLEFFHYLAIKSAVDCNPGFDVVMHAARTPWGPWWRAISHLVGVERCRRPRSIEGRCITHVAHAADLVRLDVLLAHGGVYLDIDTLCVSSFEPLLENITAMAVESPAGLHPLRLCNAVIMAESGSAFIGAWRDGFRPSQSLWSGFRSRGHDEFWAEMSVQYPGFLATLGRFPLTVLPWYYFFDPGWDELDMLSFFVGTYDLHSDSYCHHLWQQMSWSGRFLRSLDRDMIHGHDSTFTRIARQFV